MNEREIEDIARSKVLETLKNSTLFKQYNTGEAAEIEFEALKDRDKILHIAEKHGLGVLLYALYSLGFYAGKARGDR